MTTPSDFREERVRLKEAARVMKRAIEGGLLDDVKTCPEGGPRRGWKHVQYEGCDVIKARVEALLEGAGVEVWLPRRRKGKSLQLRIWVAPRIFLRTTANGQVIRREETRYE